MRLSQGTYFVNTIENYIQTKYIHKKIKLTWQLERWYPKLATAFSRKDRYKLTYSSVILYLSVLISVNLSTFLFICVQLCSVYHSDHSTTGHKNGIVCLKSEAMKLILKKTILLYTVCPGSSDTT